MNKIASKLDLIGYLILTLGVVLGFIFTWNLSRRVEKDVALRCQVSERVISIIHDDHQVKLKKSQDFLKKNPEGIPGIPRELILDSINDEKRALRLTKPHPCPRL